MAVAKKKTAKPAHENSVGAVKVHESVIASIVRKAAMSVEGVLRLGTSSLVDNLAEIVGSKKIQDRAITVEMNENSVSVEVRVILLYGVLIPQVAGEIFKLAGMKVDHVNVVIMDLEDSPDGEDGEEE